MKNNRRSLLSLSLWVAIFCLFALPVWVSAQVSGTEVNREASMTLATPTTPYDNAEACLDPANPIVAENCMEGSEEWLINNPTDSIEGFPSVPSVNLGESIDFFVDTDSDTFDLYIYRTGYYGGRGGRLMETVRDLSGTNQPECYSELYDTGLVSCGNWSKSHTLEIPDTWVSGYYVAKLVRPDTGGENYMLFVVRDDERDSEILFQQSNTTLMAYNNWGGKSVYTTASRDPYRCLTISTSSRAVEVSSLRPLRTPLYLNYMMKTGYPMLVWLEAQGYDVTYNTNMDTHRSGLADGHNELLDHKVFLIVGHDEYVTQEMRTAVTLARDAGVSIGSFSANTTYWRVRLEDDPVTGAPDSVMVNYKTTEGGIEDPIGFPTGTWRDPNGANDPELALYGVQYIGDNDSMYFPLRVTAEQGKHPIFRNTGLEDMPEGTHANLGNQIVGWEWDAVTEYSPENLDILMASPTYGGLLTDEGSYYALGEAVANTTLYTAESGALVFASGTNLWSWGLEIVEPDRRIQQITYNLLADMGVEPVVPADTLLTEGETVETPLTSPDEFKAADESDEPVISNVQIDVGSDEVTISWDTDRPAMGQIWLRSANSDWRLPNFAPNRIIVPRGTHFEYTTSHSLTSEGLDRSMDYEYFVVATDEEWRTSISPMGEFATEGGSTQARIFDTVRLPLRSAQCFIEAQPTLAIGIAAAAVVVVLLVLWRGVVFVRGRRRSA